MFVWGLIVGGLALAGCHPDTPRDTSQPAAENAADPLAKKVQITKDGNGRFVADTPILRLSKAAMDRAQWHNATDETIVLMFEGYAVGEIIPAGKWSATHHVCKDCTPAAHDYKILRLTTTGPQEVAAQGQPPEIPQVDVGS